MFTLFQDCIYGINGRRKSKEEFNLKIGSSNIGNVDLNSLSILLLRVGIIPLVFKLKFSEREITVKSFEE